MKGVIQSYHEQLKKDYGQANLQALLGIVLLVFIVFTVGDSILSNTSISKENNSLTNVAMDTLLPVVIIAAVVGIILRLF